MMCLIPGGLALLGPDCSSWTLISRGTSWRSIANPLGNVGLSWVTGSNIMISRSFVCIYVLNLQIDTLITTQVYYVNDIVLTEPALPRVTLLLFIVLALHSTFLIEQPSGSDRVFCRQSRCEHFCSTVCFAAWQN